MRLSSRLDAIEPFYVMEVGREAEAIARSAACDPARGGRRMIFLNIGEPEWPAASGVVEAAKATLDAGRTQYTGATGLPALREAIAGWYASHFGLDIAPARIVVTAGASAALQLASLALFEAGDRVLMPDPSYPCNRHFVAAAGATPVLLPTTAAQRFQPSRAQIASAWDADTRGVVLASPSNPTGTSIAPEELAAIHGLVREHGSVTIVDEIYLGLSFERQYGRSALELGDDVVSVNSFSKYFGMTGWRLGWLVLPEALVGPVERLAQNLYICASAVAQHAALACFTPAALAEYERRRALLRERRDFVVAELAAMGLPVPVVPDGAFYAWIDVSSVTTSSWDYAFELMRNAQIALTPGRDFGRAEPERWMRLSFAGPLDDLREALARWRAVLPTNKVAA